MAPVVRVVEPAGQLEHSGLATVLLPPAEKRPTSQTAQAAPPRPGAQTVRVGGERGMMVFVEGCTLVSPTVLVGVSKTTQGVEFELTTQGVVLPGGTKGFKLHALTEVAGFQPHRMRWRPGSQWPGWWSRLGSWSTQAWPRCCCRRLNNCPRRKWRRWPRHGRGRKLRVWQREGDDGVEEFHQQQCLWEWSR